MEKMRRFAVLFAFILFLTACSGGQQGTQNEPAANPPAIAPISGEGIVIENGMTQQIASYTDPMKEDYTNEGSELLRFVVYVETDNDTDMDGKPDLAKTMVQVPLQGSTNSTSRTCTRSLRSARLPAASARCSMQQRSIPPTGSIPSRTTPSSSSSWEI